MAAAMRWEPVAPYSTKCNWGARGALMVVPDDALHGPWVHHWHVWPAGPQAGTPIYPIGAQQPRRRGPKKPRPAPTAVALLHAFALLGNGSVTDWAINPSRPPLAPEAFPATGALMIYG